MKYELGWYCQFPSPHLMDLIRVVRDMQDLLDKARNGSKMIGDEDEIECGSLV